LGTDVRGIVSAYSAERGPGFVIDDLHRHDPDGADQAATLLVAAIPRWTPTMESAREVVADALAPGNFCPAARNSRAWDLHPLDGEKGRTRRVTKRRR
jgi:hypothetical protein